METTTATQADVPAGLRPQPEPAVPVQPLGTLVPVTLHWFQKDAVAAAVREVKDGGRATLVLATGSGKTLIAAACARRLAAKGSTLVLVPTIELLEQTAESWSTLGGRRGLAVAACSREEALESAEAGGRIDAAVTTQAPRIADLVAKAKTGEPVTVYATYASMERITAAHQLHGLPAWDLVVIDEAHRTAGAEGKAWAAVHDDAQIPAKRRLYFTATPRIADDRRAKDGLADLADAESIEKLPVLCSMSDETIYGKTCFTWTLGQGIEHGYLADYRVLVPVVTDEDLRELLNLPAVADLRSQRSNEELLRLALQIAVLRAVADLGLRRVITFHSRVSAAREFANTLLDASQLLEDKDRPERIWAKAVAGTDRLKDRRAAFTEFKAHTGDDGEECGILCNARLLSEGIDVRAVDAVCFADPKSSVIDIVQAVGRALRQSYRQGKVSWVIIPVYLPTPEVGDDTAAADPAEVHDAGEAVKAEADAEIEASSFRTIWRVLRALAAHDARVVGRITELRGTRSQGTALTTAAKTSESESTEAGEGEQPPAPVESPIEWLRINAKKHAAQILQTVKLRAFNPRAVEWQRMHAVAAVFHLQHGHLDPTDKAKHTELISWLTRQRHLNGQGLLDAARVSELDALGMIWSKSANAWERGAAYAAAFHRQHGHLAIPATAKLDDYAVGAWMRRQRKADNLTTDQAAKLDALDELWRLEPDWNRSYRRVLAYLAAGGTLDGPANRTGLGDDSAFRPGTWLRKQDKARSDGKLTDLQSGLLDALAPAPEPWMH
ncbi:DEAD/DEAH box helicase [Kitasatospora kazusensis]|uniref:DEAD/DEAH box helicase n=1 Tax=Kitasatospora kazusensis TaxID=407974 RepID=A0ABP5LZ46_9ACTN